MDFRKHLRRAGKENGGEGSVKNLETYFIRHPQKKISLDAKTRERMWKERRVFIHFEWDKSGNRRADSRSKNPDDYEGSAKRAVSALCRLALEGGYVCGHFDEYEEWLMGKVLPKSRIQLREGKWPEGSDKPKKHDGICVLKTLRLHKVRLVSPEDYAVLQPAQPRQGTIMRWPSIGNTVEAIVEGKKLRRSLGALSPNHQEVMCAEFLRLHEAIRIGLPRLTCVLRDVGRTMKDLDIVGLAQDGKQVFAQVTYGSFDSKDVQEKRNLLQKFSGRNAHRILFCKCERSFSEKGIIIFPIEEVYSRFRNTKVGKNWFKYIFPKNLIP
jgi:hypothetical protein